METLHCPPLYVGGLREWNTFLEWVEGFQSGVLETGNFTLTGRSRFSWSVTLKSKMVVTVSSTGRSRLK